MKMKARAHEVRMGCIDGVLAGAQFGDSFAIVVDNVSLNARRAAEQMFGRRQGWPNALLVVRDVVVRPFGLQTTNSKPPAGAIRIGFFPVVSETAKRIVAGFDDKHLDFRVIIDVSAEGGGTRVVATTLVLTHNLLGRIYLGTILPFHRLIVRSMLNRLSVGQ
jgi:Protein of unknown function (DUF2867)